MERCAEDSGGRRRRRRLREDTDPAAAVNRRLPDPFLCLFCALAALLASCASGPDPIDDYTHSDAPFEVGALEDGRPVEGLFISKTYVPEFDRMELGVSRRTDDGFEAIFLPQYRRVVPLSERLALAYGWQDDNRLRLLDLEVGEERPLPTADGTRPITTNWLRWRTVLSHWTEDGVPRSRTRVWITGSRHADGTHDVLLLDADGSVLRAVPKLRPVGEWTDRVFSMTDDFVVLDDSDAAGEPCCSTYTLDGNLLAEAVPPVRWFPLGRTEEDEDHYAVEVLRVEPAIAIGRLPNEPVEGEGHPTHGLYPLRTGSTREDRLRYWDPTIYHPLDERGVPLPLPADVAGLMRIVTHVPDRREFRWGELRDTWPQGFHSGWVVLYAAQNGGRRFGFAKGSVEDALHRAATLERYDAWEQGGLHRYLSQGSWQPARAFARRAADAVWETIDLETLTPYGSRAYGQGMAWIRPLEDPSLRELKRENYDSFDRTNRGVVSGKRRAEREARDRAREAERRKKAARVAQRAEECHAAIARGDERQARFLLTEWDLGEEEDGAWAAYYTAFGCVDRYEIEHAREAGVTGTVLQRLESNLAQSVAEQRADEEAVRRRADLEAAWSDAVNRPITVEKVEIEHLPGGMTRVRKVRVPLD